MWAVRDTATCRWRTGLDLFTKKPVPVARNLRDRKLQRAWMQFFKPENSFDVREALIQAGRGVDQLDPMGEQMPYRDPKCAYVADDFGTSGLVVGWLASNGIEAVVMDEATLGGLEGLTLFAPGRVSTRGLEVWVADANLGDAARTLLTSKAAEITVDKAARATRAGTVTALCEECGGRTDFPLASAGRTENCPHCRAYLDIPDPDAWDEGGYWNTADGDTDHT